MNRPLLRAIRATLEYDGSGFSGSQLQKSDRTVLSEVNAALSKLLDHPVRAKISSRTDAGVHAFGQVIGFRTSAPRQIDEIRHGLNGLLPDDIRATDVAETDFRFHPRYSAVGKVYLYRILRMKELPPMKRNYVLFIEEHKPFDFSVLERALKVLEGEHDFRSFSPRLEPGENPVKVIRKTSVTRDGDLTEIRFIGSGFLYQMVRRMVGLLIAVVQGREPESAVRSAIESPDLGSVRYNANPKGLILEKVLFTEDELMDAAGRESRGSRE